MSARIIVLSSMGIAAVFLPPALGISCIAVRECLYQKFVTAMVSNFDNFEVVLSKLAGFPQTVDPKVALPNIMGKLKIAEGVLCAVGVLSIIGGVALSVMSFVFHKHDRKKVYACNAGALGLVSLGGLSIGVKSMFDQMQEVLPKLYADFSVISYDGLNKQIFAEQLYGNSTPIMIGAIVAASILAAIAAAAAIVGCYLTNE